MTTPPDNPTTIDWMYDHTKQLVDEELREREANNTRAGTLIAFAGTILTIVGIGPTTTLAKEASNEHARVAIVTAVASLLAALVFAALAVRPRSSRAAEQIGLGEIADYLTSEFRSVGPETLQSDTMKSYLIILFARRAANEAKRKWLRWAGIFSAMGVVCVAVAVVFIVYPV